MFRVCAVHGKNGGCKCLRNAVKFISTRYNVLTDMNRRFENLSWCKRYRERGLEASPGAYQFVLVRGTTGLRWESSIRGMIPINLTYIYIYIYYLLLQVGLYPVAVVLQWHRITYITKITHNTQTYKNNKYYKKKKPNVDEWELKIIRNTIYKDSVRTAQ